jgi:hypothetical protein
LPSNSIARVSHDPLTGRTRAAILSGAGRILASVERVRDLDDAFAELARTPFRRRFTLNGRELVYLERKGMNTVLREGDKFMETRLAPAEPRNDGRRTPWRNHPIFIAQHATGTCCRGCLQRVHWIEKGRELTADERRHIIDVWRRWLAPWDPMKS